MLIVTGTIAFDYIMDFPGKFSDHILPSEIYKINLSFIVSNFAKRRGGTAGNTAYTLSLLETKHLLFSTAGKDFEEYKKFFDKMGSDVSRVVIDEKKYTSTGFAMTDRKNNQIWGYFYGASDNIPFLKLKTAAKKDDFVLIGPSGAKGSISMVHQSIKLGIPYMFDPGFILTQVSDVDLEAGVKNSRFLIGNDYELSLIKKRLKNFDDLVLGKTVITTFGEKGSLIENDGEKIEIGVAKVQKFVDPTGAGDAWRAGFLSGLDRGFDFKTCGQMGAVASSFAVEHYGTQEHYFSISQFEKRYRQAFGNLIKL